MVYTLWKEFFMEIIDYVVLNNFPNFLFINFLNLIFNILLIHKIVVSCVDGKIFVKYIVIGILIIEILSTSIPKSLLC